MGRSSLFEKLKKLTALQGELLRDHGTGHHQWYAENLIAVALLYNLRS
jgi:hypothetical protein